ncbi:MAG: monovalent cation/H(+) antiporter subunit G [Rhodospirillales bacterium]|nr:monovalent cation/H(+) antiporter subunit G [Rhodospirillales bacterium]
MNPETLHLLANILSWIFISGGVFFALTGALGIIRFPDVFSRMHAAGMVDTLGIGLILVGLMFHADDWIVVVKLGLVILFIFFTSPTTTFALARAALDDGMIADALPDLNKAETPSDKKGAL